MAFAFLPSKYDSYLFRIHVLIVAVKDHCNELKTALMLSNLLKPNPRLLVHITESCSIIQKSENLHIDFVVFVVDCRIPNSVKKVYEDVKLLPPELAFGRFCVINAAFGGTDISKYISKTEKLNHVFKKNNVHILSAQFDTAEDFTYTASRVIRLMSRVLNFPLNE